ncbi:MAG: arginine--tRNA ligase [Gammaproteobacteria bacterium WSBS_2016_MAG_OTU1]
MQSGEYKTELIRTLSAAAKQAAPHVNEVQIQPPRDKRHGDYACSVALQLAATLKRSPPAIAAEILQYFVAPSFVDEVQVIGGYINIRVKADAKTAVVKQILQQGKDYGRGTDKHQSVLLEFVSANPTGPLHIGHGRAAAFGDSLGNLLSFSGVQVWREYYVNDAGRQTDILAASLWLRYCLQQSNSELEMPKGSYQGDYLQDMLPTVHDLLTTVTMPNVSDLHKQLMDIENDDKRADALVSAMRDNFANADSVKAFIDMTATAALALIKNDLTRMAVAPYDCWFSEQTLHAADKLTAGIATIRQHHAESLYEEDGALWFRSTAYGDDKDRVVQRANGQYTYFAADIAYHHDKLSRRMTYPTQLINILGADHHGYVPRLTAAINALGHETQKMETIFIQFAAIVEDGIRTKMSTRGGEFVSLSFLVDEVGTDAARYFYVSRKNDQHIDFDIALATEQSGKNPVYYLQYAHARTAGIFRKWGGDVSILAEADCSVLATNPAALALCELLVAFPDTVQHAAKERAVHLFVSFLQDIAVAMHNYYEKTRILTSPPDDDMLARLALLAAAQSTLKIGLTLLGISAPERM